MSRDRTVCMMRIKDEARWIGRNLERTWQVCSKVVLWDDGSTDGTYETALNSLGHDIPERGIWKDQWVDLISGGAGVKMSVKTRWGPSDLHFLRSPYTNVVRPKERRNELRDKNCLWSYVKGAIDFEYVFCLDGDEMLSQRALAGFPETWRLLQTDDWLIFPFIYLWDSEGTRRIDGIYGDSLQDGIPTLRFPRMFTIRRLDEQQLYDTRFHWVGSRGGIHCGSIPQEGFHDIRPTANVVGGMPIIHFGYLDASMRSQKFVMYNEIDPGNEFEGHYRHIIGEPNQHAPGPVQLAPWSDQ